MSLPINIEDFDEYIRQGEPDKREKNNFVWMPMPIQDKFRTSKDKLFNQFYIGNHNILQLVLAIGEQQLSVREMMDAMSLKGRDNFLKAYLNPAIDEQYVRLLYPNSPRHPHQKYLLTVKGITLYNELTKDAT